tara:strand:- start:681 stop:857 length:177 start_codon:yes stop_codon:yes gene_type:complete
MNSLPRAKQNQVKDLKNIVGSHVPDSAVIDCLKGSNWNADLAMDKWYQNGWDSRYPAP